MIGAAVGGPGTGSGRSACIGLKKPPASPTMPSFHDSGRDCKERYGQLHTRNGVGEVLTGGSTRMSWYPTLDMMLPPPLLDLLGLRERLRPFSWPFGLRNWLAGGPYISPLGPGIGKIGLGIGRRIV